MLGPYRVDFFVVQSWSGKMAVLSILFELTGDFV